MQESINPCTVCLIKYIIVIKVKSVWTGCVGVTKELIKYADLGIPLTFTELEYLHVWPRSLCFS